MRNFGLSLVAIFPSMSDEARVWFPATSTESTARAPEGIEAQPVELQRTKSASVLSGESARTRGRIEGRGMRGAGARTRTRPRVHAVFLHRPRGPMGRYVECNSRRRAISSSLGARASLGTWRPGCLRDEPPRAVARLSARDVVQRDSLAAAPRAARARSGATAGAVRLGRRLVPVDRESVALARRRVVRAPRRRGPLCGVGSEEARRAPASLRQCHVEGPHGGGGAPSALARLREPRRRARRRRRRAARERQRAGRFLRRRAPRPVTRGTAPRAPPRGRSPRAGARREIVRLRRRARAQSSGRTTPPVARRAPDASRYA